MRVIIAAAGTAGHINPGIAIANKIKEYDHKSEILFVGTNRGLESDLVSRAGYNLKTIEAYGLKKEISIINLKHMLMTLSSRKDVKKIIDDFKPDLVLGTGGYICGPVISAALSKKVPVIFHESNAYPGKAIKMFYKKADKVLVGFEDTKERLENKKNVVVTGNPTKMRKLEISEEQKKKILLEMGIKNDLPIVLVFGGSQGAKTINDSLSDLLIKKLNENYQIIWATGKNQYDSIKEKLEENNLYFGNLKNVKVLPYIYNMEELMNIADLIVCRSGAMTTTEIAICGKPAVFIPLPSRGANRQEDNAKVLEKLDAARIILNDELTAEKLSARIDEIITDKSRLKEMGENARKIAIPNVEEKIYFQIKEVVN